MGIFFTHVTTELLQYSPTPNPAPVELPRGFHW